MKQYIKTAWYYHVFDVDHSSESGDTNLGAWGISTYVVKKESLEKGMNDLSKYCNENNYEIKGIIPIDKAQTMHAQESDWKYETKGNAGYGYGYGWGYGWGVTMPDGFAAMLQSIEMLSDEEYDKRIEDDKRIADEKDRLLEEKDILKKSIKEAEDRIIDTYDLRDDIETGVRERTSGMFKKKVTYHVAGKEFSNREDAEAKLNEMIEDLTQFDKENNQTKKSISEYEEALSICVNKLKNI